MSNSRIHSARTLLLAILICATVILVASCGGDNGIFGTVLGNSGIPGERAGDFLSGAEYTSLVVEVQAFEGMQPTQAAMDSLTAFLQDRLNKPGGIQLVFPPELPASAQSTYSIAEIRQIEAQSRTTYPNGQTMAAYLLLVDRESDQSGPSGRILGHAYGATSMVIYQSAIQELSGGLGEPPRDVLESTVIRHEFGHIFGLVGTGSPPVDPGHHDQPNGAHCTNNNCLMHYSVEVSDVVANLLGGNIPPLDSDCINDLRNMGGK